MRDKERIDRITQKLAAVWILYPQQRLMQLLLNLISDSDAKDDLFYLEDNTLEEILDGMLLERGWQ